MSVGSIIKLSVLYHLQRNYSSVYCLSDMIYTSTMSKKPKLHDVRDAKETLKRWYFVAKERGKKSAMAETKRIYEMLQYFEDTTDWNKFD